MPISVATPRSLPGLSAPLRALVRGALALEGRHPGQIGVVLAGDDLLRELNRDYRGLDRATDVLSFAYDAEGGGVDPATHRAPRVHGDLVVSMDRVREQARRFRVSEGRELARLVVHGALHLAGLDHQRSAERRRMRSREDHVLRGGATAIDALERALRGAVAARRRAPAGRRG